MSAVPRTESDLQVLERFIAENDELVELESLVGRFNVFDALGASRRELSHSHFLAWLLDPNGTHGQGDLFLRAILMDLVKQSRGPSRDTPISLLELDGKDLHDTTIYREWRNIDIFISCPGIKLVIAIENKVDSGEHSSQLERYKAIVRQSCSGMRAIFVFLTTDGDDSTDGDWLPYSYGDVHRVLSRTKAQAAGSLGTDVGVFLEHYLKLLGSRMMEDGEIQKLCRKIYVNHKRAIDLINKHAGGDAEPVLAAFAEAVREKYPQVEIFDRTSTEVRLLPPDWKAAQPPIGTLENERVWLVMRLLVKRNRCWLGVRTLLVEDQAKRNLIVRELIDPLSGLDLRTSFKTWEGQKRVLLTAEQIASWKDDEEPDAQKIADEAVTRLTRLLERLSALPDVVRRAASTL